jgi:hypothetical protein
LMGYLMVANSGVKMVVMLVVHLELKLVVKLASLKAVR